MVSLDVNDGRISGDCDVSADDAACATARNVAGLYTARFVGSHGVQSASNQVSFEVGRLSERQEGGIRKNLGEVGVLVDEVLYPPQSSL